MYTVVRKPTTPLLSECINNEDGEHGFGQDLESLYHQSHICQATSTKLEPLIAEMSQSEGGYVNHSVSCARDSYRTNILWQVQ